jgi:putative hemolysin
MPIPQPQPNIAPNTRLGMETGGDKLQVSSYASNLVLTPGAYWRRLAESREGLEAAFRLRFLVFNLELNEGLESAYETGLDTDEFDRTCDHLIVEHRPSQRVVGTYRLQTGRVAGSNLGYYSEREFDFSPYEAVRNSLVELGRASIHRDHRSFEVLTLLWRGIAVYATQEKRAI